MVVAQSTRDQGTPDGTLVYNQRAPWLAALVVYAAAVVASIVAATGVLTAGDGFDDADPDRWYVLGWILFALAAVPLVFARAWVQSEAWIPQVLRYSSCWSDDPDAEHRHWRSFLLTAASGLVAALAATLLADRTFTTFLYGLLVSIPLAGFAPAVTVLARRLYRWMYVILAGLLFSGLGVLAELDTALRGMTKSGNEQLGFSALSPLLRPWNAPDRIETAARNWNGYAEDFSDAFEPTTTRPPFPLEAARWHVMVDSAIVVSAYALLLVCLISWLIRELPVTTKGQQLKAILSVSRFTAPVLAMVDHAENFAGLGAVRLGTYSAPLEENGKRAIDFGIVSDHLALIRGFAATFKWVLILGIAAACVIAIATWLRTSGNAQRETIRPLRAHIALVVLIFLLLRTGQATDAIRDWQVNVNSSELAGVPMTFTLVFALLAGVTIRYLADFTLRQSDLAKVPGNRWPSERPPRVGYGLLSLSIALVLAIFLKARGLLVPVFIFFLLEAMSWPLQESETGRRGIGDRVRELWGWRKDGAFARLAGVAILLFTTATVANLWRGRSAVRWVLILGAVAGLVHAARQLSNAIKADPDAVSPVSPTAEPDPTPNDSGQDEVLAATEDVGAEGSTVNPRHTRRDASATRRREHSIGAAAAYMGSRINKVTVPTPSAEYGLPSFLGTLVLVVLGSAVVKSAASLVIYRSGGVAMVVLGLLAIGLGALLMVLPKIEFSFWESGLGLAAVRLVVIFLFGTYLLIWELVSVDNLIRSAQQIGAIGLVFAFSIVAAALASVISYLTEQTSALPSLRLVGFTRIPFYLLIGVWIAINSAIDGGGYHNVDRSEFTVIPDQVQEVASGESDDVTVIKAFDEWFEDCRNAIQPDRSERPTRTMPMVFVAATGGGIRAAYWTSTALERFSEEVAQLSPCDQPIFALSGASGGSVGLATHVARELNSSSPQASTVLDQDFLAPSVGWLLFVDSFRPLFLWDPGGGGTSDRAAVLARSFELAWPDDGEPAPTPSTIRPGCAGWLPESGPVTISTGIRSTWCRGAPLLLMNGTEVNSGCRFLISVLDNRSSRADGQTSNSVNCRRPPGNLGTSEDGTTSRDTSEVVGPLGATIDAVDYLCQGEDFALSVGSTLSARFPFISPSGRIEQCEELTADPHVAYVVDGGYLDNSGAASIVELWSEVALYVDDKNSDSRSPCIVPIFLQIDNGYDFANPSAASRPIEAFAPFTAAAASLSSREAEAKQVAANIFGTSAVPGDRKVRLEDGSLPSRWIRIVPEAHPGLQAPLGWVLSGAAENDLREELNRDPAFDELQKLFDSEVRCTELRATDLVQDDTSADPVAAPDS